MLNKRTLTFCLILAVFAAALRIIPHISGAAFIFIDILSGFLIYLAAKFNWILGAVVYLTSIALSASIDMGEAVFFICTNGTIGLSLGIIQNRMKNIYLIPAISALLVISMFFIVNYLFQISIFGYSPLESLIQQAFALFLSLYIYCFIFLRLAKSADSLLNKYLDFHIY